MYRIIDTPKRMSLEQIIEEFNGKWVFFVNIEGPPTGWFDSAIPVVVADKPFEGSETGIYKKLHDENDGNSMDWALPPNKYSVFGFSEGTN